VDFWRYGEVQNHTGTSTTPLISLGVLGYFADFVGMLYVRARHLRVDLGLWLSVDRLWPQEATFGYASQSPVNFVDPTGYLCYSENTNVLRCSNWYDQYCLAFCGIFCMTGPVGIEDTGHLYICARDANPFLTGSVGGTAKICESLQGQSRMRIDLRPGCDALIRVGFVLHGFGRERLRVLASKVHDFAAIRLLRRVWQERSLWREKGAKTTQLSRAGV
jgi:RHS repeat-associated protein